MTFKLSLNAAKVNLEARLSSNLEARLSSNLEARLSSNLEVKKEKIWLPGKASFIYYNY